jgi:hypothetical protein
MKTPKLISRIVRIPILTALSVLISAGVACTTTYDSAGRQVQSVDPGAAVAGAAAAGILGYAIGNSNDNSNRQYYRNNNYNRRGSRGYYHR